MPALAPPPAAVAACPGPPPAAFLRAAYAPYVAGRKGADLSGPGAGRIFDRELASRLQADARGHPGEVGRLDYDPLCNCQDFERLERLTIHVRARGPAASADTRFVNGGVRVRVTIRLRCEAAGWRIGDIASPELPSLLGLLRGKG